MKWRFEDAVYDRYRESFWPMPNSFVAHGHLARLWKAEHRSKGRCSGAAIAILPIIGTHSNTVQGGLWMGQGKMAALAGISVSSVREGAGILEATGLGAHSLHTQPNGLPVSTWTLDAAAFVRMGPGVHADPSTGSGSLPNYFSFPARALFGGNWCRLTPVQQAIYLAVGAHVRTHQDREDSRDFLECILPAESAATILARTGRLMLTTDLSLSVLQRVTGISRSALSHAIGDLPQDEGALCGAIKMTGSGKHLFVVYDDFDPDRSPAEDITSEVDEAGDAFPWELDEDDLARGLVLVND